MIKNTIEGILEKIERHESGCWSLPFACDGDGYSQIKLDGQTWKGKEGAAPPTSKPPV